MPRKKVDDEIDVHLGDVLARAGEGTIYAVADRPDWAAKVFHPTLTDLSTKLAKVEAMADSPPPGAVQPDGFVVLTWPLDTLEMSDGSAGYIMHRVATATSVEIHVLSNPSNRMNPLPSAPQWPKRAAWHHLVNVAANLCLAVGTVHRVNAVIGDFQERNILVSDDTRVTLVDCDSMQFTDSDGHQFLCGVARPEFTAPELADTNLRTEPREKTSDLFALAVHIYLLLMGGNHPFMRGRWTGSGEQPDALTLAKAGQWASGPNSLLRKHPLAPSVGYLPAEIQQLFLRAFTEGSRDPSRRPSADEWRRALGRIQVAQCAEGVHEIPTSAAQCPWCAIDKHRRVRKQQQQRAEAPTPAPAQTRPAATPSMRKHRLSAVWTVAILLALVAAVLVVAVSVVKAAGHKLSGAGSSSTHSSSATAVTESPTPIVLPAGAVECSTEPSLAPYFTHSARGNDDTSCPFADNVRAEVNIDTSTLPKTVSVYSPTTKQSYSMACSAGPLVTCTGGNGAVVYVY